VYYGVIESAIGAEIAGKLVPVGRDGGPRAPESAADPAAPQSP
jgi:hypothetical protein